MTIANEDFCTRTIIQSKRSNRNFLNEFYTIWIYILYFVYRPIKNYILSLDSSVSHIIFTSARIIVLSHQASYLCISSKLSEVLACLILSSAFLHGYVVNVQMTLILSARIITKLHPGYCLIIYLLFLSYLLTSPVGRRIFLSPLNHERKLYYNLLYQFRLTG